MIDYSLLNRMARELNLPGIVQTCIDAGVAERAEMRFPIPFSSAEQRTLASSRGHESKKYRISAQFPQTFNFHD